MTVYLPSDKTPDDTIEFIYSTCSDMVKSNANMTQDVDDTLRKIEESHYPLKTGFCRTITITLLALAIIATVNVGLTTGVIFTAFAVIPIGCEWSLRSQNKAYLKTLHRHTEVMIFIFRKLTQYLNALRHEKEKAIIEIFNNENKSLKDRSKAETNIRAYTNRNDNKEENQIFRRMIEVIYECCTPPPVAQKDWNQFHITCGQYLYGPHRDPQRLYVDLTKDVNGYLHATPFPETKG